MSSEAASLGSVHNACVGSLIEAHDFETAFAEIDRIIDRHRAGTEAARDDLLSYHLNTRGYLHIQLGRYDQALVDCTEARRLNPDLDQNNLSLANLFANHYHGTIVPGMARVQDGSCRAMSSIARAYYNTGFHAAAASYYQLAISVAEIIGLAALYNDLSAAYLGGGLPIEAYQASARAVMLDPDLDRTNYSLALMQVEGLGQDPGVFMSPPARPQPCAEHSDGIDEFLAHNHTASLRHFDQKVSEARRQLTADEDSPEGRLLPGYLNHRAMCHLNLGNFDQAVEDCLEARRLDIDIDHSNLRLCQLFRAKYNDELRPLFAMLKAEISAETYNAIGVVFHQNGLHAQAATYFQLAITLAEGLVLAESYNNLAGAYLDGGYYIEALRAASMAVALNPDINKVNYNLVRARLKPMQIDEDALLIDRFASLVSDDGEGEKKRGPTRKQAKKVAKKQAKVAKKQAKVAKKQAKKAAKKQAKK